MKRTVILESLTSIITLALSYDSYPIVHTPRVSWIKRLPYLGFDIKSLSYLVSLLFPLLLAEHFIGIAKTKGKELQRFFLRKASEAKSVQILIKVRESLK